MPSKSIARRLRAGSALPAVALLLAGGLTSAAYAQDTSAAPGTAAVPPSGPLASQNVAPASSETSGGAPAQEIVVTGSRILQPNLQSASPITAINQQEIKLSGSTNIEDIVNSLPQAFTSQTSGLANGADGTATVNLRNLGDTRTLVLIDGLRLPPGDPSRAAGSRLGSAADINNIPTILVKRVDVLTGGASAAYGADAVAGVVNFILDEDFTGVKLDFQGGFFNHLNGSSAAANAITSDPRYNATGNGISLPRGQTTDGGSYDVSLAAGSKFGSEGQGHFSVFVNYHHQAPVLLGDRDYSNCSLGSNEIDAGPGNPSSSRAADLYCAGSSNTAQTSFLNNGGNGTRQLITAGSTVRAYNGATDAYNFNPTNYFQRPDERYNAGGFASYEIDEHFKPYVNFLFMDDHSLAQIAPSGTFNNVFTINCNNPLLSGAVRTGLGCTSATSGTVDVALAKRNVEGGGRVDDLRHTDYRIVGGMKGEIIPGWHYDAHYQYGATIYNEHYLNDFSRSRVQNAINNCVGTTDQTCSPYNIFTGTTTVQPTAATGVTQAALDYVQTPGFKTGTITEIVASGVIQGDLGTYGIKSPFAQDGINIAFGPEYRKESLTLDTDTEYATGDLLGQGGQTKSVSGSYDVKEAFVEASVPLISQKPGFQSLLFDGAYRYSDYSSVGHTNTWKLSLEWSPFSGDLEGAVRFRGSINRAVRAPTIQDFYAPSQLGLGGSGDDCAQRSGGRASSQTLATCLRTAQGDPNFATQFADGLGIARNPASQYNSVTAGSVTAGSNLLPETAITKTIGAVFAPRHLLRGFTASVDYYTINLKNRIGTDGYGTILAQCLNTGSAYYCGLIHRDPTNGSLWLTPNGYISDPIYNAGHLKTRGIDVSAGYSYDAGKLGHFSASFQGTYLMDLKYEVLLHNSNGSLSSNGYYNCVGYYDDASLSNCGVPSPRWRHKLRVTYSPLLPMTFSVGWRFLSGTSSMYANPAQGLDGSGSLISGGGYSKADLRNTRIPSYNYVDLAVTFNVAKHLELRAGVNNITDKDPPIIAGGEYNSGNINGNTYPGYYDALGRYFFGGATLRF